MNKKLILALITVFIVSCILASAMSEEDKENYMPSWFGESWEANWGDGPANIMQNFWLSLSPFSDKGDVDAYADADIYGWYKDSWFGLANWEREVCLLDLSTDVRNVRNVVEDSYLETTTVYTTTITITATKDYGIDDTYLYEVSWYIMPYGGNAIYRVYLMKGNAKYYFAGKKGDGDDKWVPTIRYSGDAKYAPPKYLNVSYEKVVLEYRDEIGSGEYSEDINEMVVSVVPKQDFPDDDSDAYDSGEEVEIDGGGSTPG